VSIICQVFEVAILMFAYLCMKSLMGATYTLLLTAAPTLTAARSAAFCIRTHEFGVIPKDGQQCFWRTERTKNERCQYSCAAGERCPGFEVTSASEYSPGKEWPMRCRRHRSRGSSRSEDTAASETSDWQSVGAGT